MLGFIRNILSSRFGMIGALAFLVLIGLAFAGSDIAGDFGARTAGGSEDNVAIVGKTAITANALQKSAQNALQSLKADNPSISMQEFVAAGGLTDVLNGEVNRLALLLWGQQNGVTASERLIDSEIINIPAFHGADGKFDQNLFNQALVQQGISEQAVRSDITQSLIARQIMIPATFGTRFPEKLTGRYSQLLTDRRRGSVALLPIALFAPKSAPDDKTLTDWYNKNKAIFTRPERREIRYALFSDKNLPTPAAPTDEEIAARYKADAKQYEALESRGFIQLIFPDKQTAQSAFEKARQGISLEEVASARGLSTAQIHPASRAELESEAGKDLAALVFATPKNSVAGPVRGSLGWYVIKVTAVDVRAAKTLDAARGEILAKITEEKRLRGLSDTATRIEELFDQGASLSEVAKEYGLEVHTTGPVTADGTPYGGTGPALPQSLASILDPVFAMDEENSPQIGALERGQSYVLFDVSKIALSAPAPLAEIKGDVTQAYIADKGYNGAEKAARSALADIRKGKSLNDAIKATGLSNLPAPQQISFSRTDLARMQQAGQAPPPPLLLLFSIAEGSTKLLPIRNVGWFVVQLDKVTPGEIDAQGPIAVSLRKELSGSLGNEYAAALSQAIRSKVGVKFNNAAIDALKGLLAGEQVQP